MFTATLLAESQRRMQQLRHEDSPSTNDRSGRCTVSASLHRIFRLHNHQEQHLEAGGGFSGSSMITSCFLFWPVETLSTFSLLLFSSKPVNFATRQHLSSAMFSQGTAFSLLREGKGREGKIYMKQDKKYKTGS